MCKTRARAAHSLFAKTKRPGALPSAPPSLSLVPLASFTRGRRPPLLAMPPKKWDIISGFRECLFFGVFKRCCRTYVPVIAAFRPRERAHAVAALWKYLASLLITREGQEWNEIFLMFEIYIGRARGLRGAQSFSTKLSRGQPRFRNDRRPARANKHGTYYGIIFARRSRFENHRNIRRARVIRVYIFDARFESHSRRSV